MTATEQNIEMRLGDTWVIGFDASGVEVGAALAFVLALGDQLLFQLDDTAFDVPAPAAAAPPSAPAATPTATPATPMPAWRRRRLARGGLARTANATVTVSPTDQDGLEPETYLYEIRATGTGADQSVACVQFGRIMAGATLFDLPVVTPMGDADGAG